MLVHVALVVAMLLATAFALSRRGSGIYDTPNPTAADLDPGPTTQGLQLAFSQAASDLVGAARKLFALPAEGLRYAEAITKAEQANGIPQTLLARLLYQESRFRQDIITGKTRSPVGALGIAQFMPETAREMGVDPLNPDAAINAAGRYLRRMYDATGSWDTALASYNWGIGNVWRMQRSGQSLDQAAPVETRAYVSEILGDVEV